MFQVTKWKSIALPVIKVCACLFLALSLGLGVFSTSGCVVTGKKDISTGTTMLEPSAIQKFPDIPVPRNFQFLPSSSYAFKSGNVRVGVLVYGGRANTEQLVAFYQEQMPLYNWNLLNTIEYGRRLLNFDRDNETCQISIEAGTLRTKVTISIGPKQQSSAKKSQRPIK